MNKSVTLLLDHPARDLFQYCLIGEQLSLPYNIDFQDGYFTPHGPVFFKRVNKSEKFILTPSYHVLRTPNIRLRKNFSKSKLILYHSEQLINEISYREKFNLDCFKEFDNDISLHLVWGRNFKNLLIDHGINKNKIKVVGNAKFDILKKTNINFDKNKNILFITNFTGADFSDAEWDNYKKEYFIDMNDYSNRDFSKIRKNFISEIQKVKNEISRLGYNIIIRKHPGENPKDYEEICGDNIFLSKNEELYDDLSSSRIVFTYTSSVVFESTLLGVKTFSIKWGELEKKYMQIPSDKYFWHNPSDLINIVRNPSKFQESISKDLFENYFGDIKSLSSTRVADEINKFVKQTKFKDGFNYLSFFNLHGITFLIKNILNFLSTKFNILSLVQRKVNKNYSSWLELDHHTNLNEIMASKNKSKIFLKSYLNDN
jgi:surface carbohydrate biosynthesis protein